MTRFFRGAGLAAVFAVSALAAQAETTLKFAHPVPETDLQQNLALEFKRIVEERTGGEVKVQIFPNGLLGNDQQMIDGTRSGIIDVTLVGLNNYTGLVPEAGAFELPFACRRLAVDHDAVIALGCVIRGETTHYDYVCAESARGLQYLAVGEAMAVGYGILTVENDRQAWARASVDKKNKGRDAAEACLAMIALKKQFGLV